MWTRKRKKNVKPQCGVFQTYHETRWLEKEGR